MNKVITICLILMLAYLAQAKFRSSKNKNYSGCHCTCLNSSKDRFISGGKFNADASKCTIENYRNTCVKQAKKPVWNAQTRTLTIPCETRKWENLICRGFEDDAKKCK